MGGFMKRWAHVLVPALILSAAVVIKYRNLGFVEDLQNLIFDQYQRLKPRQYEPVPVRVLDIDNESLARLGQWPWPRTEVARMIDRLRQLGAKSIAFDMVFAEPDRTSPENVFKRLPQTDELKSLVSRLPDNDRILGQSMAKGRVVAGVVLISENGDRKPVVRAKFVYNDANDPFYYVDSFPGILTNLPVVEAGAAGHGNFSFQPERDGVIRRVPMLFGFDPNFSGKDKKLVPSLSLEAMRVYAGADKYRLNLLNSGISWVQVGKLTIPTDPRGRVWIYDTGHIARRAVPAWKIFEKDFDPKPIKDNIVFIGTSAPGLMDLRFTPLNSAAAGVDLHAQAAEQVLLNKFIGRPEWAFGAETVFLVLFSIGLFLLLPRLGALFCGAIGIGAVAAAFAFSWYAFSLAGLLFEPVIPSLTLLMVYSASSLIGYIRTESEKRQIRGAFSQYMSPALVEQLAAHPERLHLGGEMREMTFLFTDIRGFTTISEHFDPQGLTKLINSFLTPMTAIILDRKGTIDKYMGDCIMAFWNAPLDDLEHPRNACLAALQMRSRLLELNKRWEVEAQVDGRPFIPIRVGVGINTGKCSVGNFGSDQRFDYSVLGDEVNLASRLEGQTKAYGVDILLGEKAVRHVPNMACLELDLLQVKGKTEPVRVYALLGDAQYKDEDFEALCAAQDAMLAAYREQDWDEAAKLVRRCAKLASDRGGPVDLAKFYKVYSERVKTYKADPPGKDWDGVFVATSK